MEMSSEAADDDEMLGGIEMEVAEDAVEEVEGNISEEAKLVLSFEFNDDDDDEEEETAAVFAKSKF